MSQDVQLNMKGLESLLKALKKPPVIQVGIMGKTARDDGKTNAQVGAWHEFGTTTLPMRSFLRVPLADNLEKYMRRAGALDKDTIARVLKIGTLRPWLEKVAVLAEAIVQEGFSTSGFGKWPASNMARKKVHQTLVESQQLRNSITSKVVGA